MIENLKTVRELLNKMYSNSHCITERQKKAADDALDALEKAMSEPVAYAVYWGLGNMRKNSVHLEMGSAQQIAAQIKASQKFDHCSPPRPPSRRKQIAMVGCISLHPIRLRSNRCLAL